MLYISSPFVHLTSLGVFLFKPQPTCSPCFLVGGLGGAMPRFTKLTRSGSTRFKAGETWNVAGNDNVNVRGISLLNSQHQDFHNFFSTNTGGTSLTFTCHDPRHHPNIYGNRGTTSPPWPQGCCPQSHGRMCVLPRALHSWCWAQPLWQIWSSKQPQKLPEQT